MRAGPATRVALAAVCAVIVGLATPGWAESNLVDELPAGSLESDESDLDEDAFDAAFDDAFEAELAETSDMDQHDPLETPNRKVFAFNEGVFEYVIDPVVSGYRFVVPKPARTGLRRLFLNLDSPRILINDLFQLRFQDAGETLGRFVLNTAFGFGGLLDVGAAAGWERHEADFGQTLGKYHVPSGPYLIVPVFGPTTVRDGLGSIIDLGFQPLAYVLGPAEIMLQVYIRGGHSFTFMDANRDKLDALEDSSVDFYAAMRSAYLQSRWAAVAEARGEDPAGAGDPVVAEPSANGPSPSLRAEAAAH